jgi:fumarylacetoacetase
VTPEASDSAGFGEENLPYGVDDQGHVVVPFGDRLIDLSLAGDLGVDADVFSSGSLNAFMGLGTDSWRTVRESLGGRLASLPAACQRPRAEVPLRIPFEVADYVDFYSSLEHATAMGRLLRPGSDPLPPSWRHLPIGYHGRSATVIVSGGAIPRPQGLRAVAGGYPEYGPTGRLDVEVELGFVVGIGNQRGEPIPPDAARQHVFGVILVNDWSARDIQAFEYQPLGPFLGKSFATSISPFVVPLAALERFRVSGPEQQPPPAPYLSTEEPRGLEVQLELLLNGSPISTMSSAALYWSMSQQLSHLTANGASVRTGDLFATGTISGSSPKSAGSLMELTAAGRQPLALPGGVERSFLEDGDEVEIRGWCGEKDRRGWVSLGEVKGTVVPVRN